MVLAQPIVAILLNHVERHRRTWAPGTVLAVLAAGLPGFTVFQLCVRGLQSMQRARDVFSSTSLENGAQRSCCAVADRAPLARRADRERLDRLHAPRRSSPSPRSPHAASRSRRRSGRCHVRRSLGASLVRRARSWRSPTPRPTWNRGVGPRRALLAGASLAGRVGLRRRRRPAQRRVTRAARERCKAELDRGGTMARIRVVTDSACDMPEEIARRLDIDIVSLTIRFGDEEFTDRVDLSPERVLGQVQGVQDPARDRRALARRLPGRLRAREGDGLRRRRSCSRSRPLLSATNQSATLGAEAVRGPHRRARRRHAGGVDGPGPARHRRRRAAPRPARRSTSSSPTPSRSRDQGRRRARCSTPSTTSSRAAGSAGRKALLGQVLSIKPLLELKDGVVAEAGRQRTPRARRSPRSPQVAKAHAPLRAPGARPRRRSSEVDVARGARSPTSRPRTRSSSPTSDRSSARTAGPGSSDCAGSRPRAARHR